jgi:iron complex outermembrane receptor protein
VLALSFGIYVNGQAEMIDTIQVSATALRESNFGSSLQALSKSSNVAEALQESSAVFLKSYGPGSLTTSSIRGGSASHTLVLWNNLPIQNPFLGLLDLSLLDTWAINETKLQKGGNSAMWGSGAIGGTITMLQKNQDQGRVLFENDFTVASFGRLHEKAKLSVRLGKLRSVTSISSLRAENNFPYQLSNGEVRNQSNARQEQDNINQDLYYTIDQQNEVSFHYWRSVADRQNPPTTVQNRSEAYQTDKADRFSAHWKHIGDTHRLKMNIGYFMESLDYFDPMLRTASLTDFTTFILDINDELNLGKHHTLNYGFSQYNTTVDSPSNYASSVSESRSAVFARYQYKYFQLSGRQEMVDGDFIPFVPSAAVEWPLNKPFVLKGKVSRNYRLPTLNDRFWERAGNPDLLPESGWSQEVGLQYKKSGLNLSITAFNRTINNWIQWALLDGDNLFKPYNLNKVWSRGLEFETAYETKKLQVRGHYNLARSTNTKAVLYPKIQAGDQLFYTPMHTGMLSIKVNFKTCALRYQQRFASASLGLNENLDPYSTGDFILNASFKWIKLRLGILNIWNTQYRVVERRPMPGRNYEIGLNINIVKK